MLGRSFSFPSQFTTELDDDEQTEMDEPLYFSRDASKAKSKEELPFNKPAPPKAAFVRCLRHVRRLFSSLQCWTGPTYESEYPSPRPRVSGPELDAIWKALPESLVLDVLLRVSPDDLCSTLLTSRRVHIHLQTNWNEVRRHRDFRIRLVYGMFSAVFEGPRFYGRKELLVQVTGREAFTKRVRPGNSTKPEAKPFKLTPSLGWRTLDEAIETIQKRFEISSIHFRHTDIDTMLRLRPLFVDAIDELKIDGVCLRSAKEDSFKQLIEEYAPRYLEVQHAPSRPLIVLDGLEAPVPETVTQLSLPYNPRIQWTEDFLLSARYEFLVLGKWPAASPRHNPARSMRRWLELWYEGRRDEAAFVAFLDLPIAAPNAKENFQNDIDLQEYLIGDLKEHAYRVRDPIFNARYELKSRSGQAMTLIVKTDHARRVFAVVFFITSEAPVNGPFQRQAVDDIILYGKIRTPSS